MIFNPEFQRNVWLEFSPFKLIAAPLLVLCLILFFMSASDVGEWLKDIFGTAVIVYFAVVFLWGNYAAASSAPSEIKSNTWDFQRMSSLGPWELTFGKLFGATSYTWYFGAFLLILIGFSHYAIKPQSLLEAVADGWPQGWLYLVLVLILSGVTGQAAALLISLYNFRYQKSGIIGAAIIGIFVSGAMFSHAIQMEKMQVSTDAPGSHAIWYAWHVPETIFVLCSILFFMMWIIMGAQRMMREELQYKNTPIMWVLFCATTAIYLAGTTFNLPDGLIGSDKMSSARVFLSYVLIIMMTYIIMFSEAGNLAKYKRWFFHLKERAWIKSLEHMPAWAGSLALILPLLIATNIVGTQDGANHLEIFSFSVALLLFTIRDGLVIHAFLLGKDAARARFKLVFYYVMIYGILPALYLVTYKNDSLGSTPVFFPTYSSDVLWSLGPIIVEVAIAVFFLLFKLQYLTLRIRKKA